MVGLNRLNKVCRYLVFLTFVLVGCKEKATKDKFFISEIEHIDVSDIHFQDSTSIVECGTLDLNDTNKFVLCRIQTGIKYHFSDSTLHDKRWNPLIGYRGPSDQILEINVNGCEKHIFVEKENDIFKKERIGFIGNSRTKFSKDEVIEAYNNACMENAEFIPKNNLCFILYKDSLFNRNCDNATFELVTDRGVYKMKIQ